MSDLKQLVPPLELCKQIPEGNFTATALVWCGDTFYQNIYVLPRACGCIKKDVDIAAATGTPINGTKIRRVDIVSVAVTSQPVSRITGNRSVFAVYVPILHGKNLKPKRMTSVSTTNLQNGQKIYETLQFC